MSDLIANTVRAGVFCPSGPKINMGCGRDIRAGWCNADMASLPGVDVVCDADLAWPWADGTIAEVRASHVFEHIEAPAWFMAEAWRVLMPGGLLDIRVPGGAYVQAGYWLPHETSFTDPTHVRHCAPHTWDYWIAGTDLHKAFGAAAGSPPVIFENEKITVNGDQGNELQAILRKAVTDGA